MIISNKYKLIKKVGSGAFGEIYKGKSNFENTKISSQEFKI
jgi:serine/threonine protein kinase